MRCIIEGCDRKATARGLCHSCYLTALRLIQAGETSWELLEQAGLCGPMMKAPNAFAKAYSKQPAIVKELPEQTHLFEEPENEH